jgi:hypothetical protein
MGSFSINIGTVKEVENTFSKDGYDGLRVRAELMQDKPKDINDIPWAFPLLPKTLQSIPKVGEAVFVLLDDSGQKTANQRYFIGPIISQPQYNTYCDKKNATTLLQTRDRKPIGKISNVDATRGAFPKSQDVAVVGRGLEDIILRYNDDSKTSEVDLRAGIRGEPTNSQDENMVGNIIFNDTDPAYIQLKYKQGIATHEKNAANSVINMVANRINIMSNKDYNVAHNLNDKDMLVQESKMDEIMDSLHQVPMGDKLVELLKIMKGAIMHHVHPWAGMEQCGDWAGFINKLEGYDIDSILSQYVRIS